SKGTRGVTARDPSDGTKTSGEARVWDAATLQPISPPLAHGNQVSHACFSPDGQHVLTASWDGTARQWNAATGEPFGSPLQQFPRGVYVNHAAYSPDGSRVVTSGGKTAQLWDATRGEPTGSPMRRSSLIARR